MVSFNGIKKRLWLISILAGILGFIAIITPVRVLLSDNMLGWIFGVVAYDGNYTFISTDLPEVILGDYIALVYIFGTIILLIGGLLSKRKDSDINFLYLIGGILLLGGIITYMIGTSVLDPLYWVYFNVHIGAILAYIAGALGVAAGIIGIVGKHKKI
ncbi:MAG: hypothetical protein ACFFCV_11510 [Promethearchaeota archaeon]